MQGLVHTILQQKHVLIDTQTKRVQPIPYLTKKTFLNWYTNETCFILKQTTYFVLTKTYLKQVYMFKTDEIYNPTWFKIRCLKWTSIGVILARKLLRVLKVIQKCLHSVMCPARGDEIGKTPLSRHQNVPLIWTSITR